MGKILALEYRPKTFEDVSEQSAVTAILKNQIESGDIKNGYLFVGSSGCGKTTSARIFANEINKGFGNPIELDAASNNGIDDIRRIIDQSKVKAIDCEYKVFIIDECFTPETKIKTVDGDKNISDIKSGDLVYGLNGINKVFLAKKNIVDLNRLVVLKLSNGTTIKTTKDHKFFTNNGWKEAQYLGKEDLLYDFRLSKRDSCLQLFKEEIQDFERSDYSQFLSSIAGLRIDEATVKECSELVRICLSNLSKIREEKDFRHEKDVFKDLWKIISEDFRNFDEKNFDQKKLCLLWKDFFNGEKTKEMLFEVMSKTIYFESLEEFLQDGEGTYSCSECVSKNVDQKSYGRYQDNQQDVGNEKIESNIACLEGQKGWKWSNNLSSTIINRSVSKDISSFNMATRITCSDPYEEKFGLSDQLQDRYSMSRPQIRNRGRWERSFEQKFSSKRFKEDKSFEFVRVEDIAFYESSNRERSEFDFIGDKERNSGTIELYDLQIDGHPSYYANGVLAHNCHSLSLSAWNSLLKVLEEPPKHVVFILCTTEPKKVIPTILSRVQRFDFRRISFNGIYNRLKYIIESENKLGENIQYSEEAIQFIAKMAEGGMRLAISMLDKCLSYSHNLDIDIVSKALGSMKYDQLFDLLNSVIDNNKQQILEIVDKAFLDGLDMKQYISDYANFLLDVNIYCLTKDINKIKIPNLYLDQLNKIDSNLSKNLDNLLYNTTQLVNVVKYDDKPKFLILTGLLAQAERLV